MTVYDSQKGNLESRVQLIIFKSTQIYVDWRCRNKSHGQTIKVTDSIIKHN